MRAQSTHLRTKVFSHIRETEDHPLTGHRRKALCQQRWQKRSHPRGEGRAMPHALTTASHGRLPREHLLPTSLGMKLPYSVPKRQFWVGGCERPRPRSQGLTTALPWPRPQSLPSVAVIRLVIPVRVPPALKHEGTAAQTMELGRASATPRKPLPRRGGALPQPLGGARREPSGDSWRACWPSVS